MSRQSRRMSFVESLVNVGVGFGVAVLTQTVVFPLFGLRATIGQNLGIGAIFTVVSIARSYALRRLFEHVHVRRAPGRPRSPVAAIGATACFGVAQRTLVFSGS
jgi:hypothetical protein